MAATDVVPVDVVNLWHAVWLLLFWPLCACKTQSLGEDKACSHDPRKLKLQLSFNSDMMHRTVNQCTNCSRDNKKKTEKRAQSSVKIWDRTSRQSLQKVATWQHAMKLKTDASEIKQGKHMTSRSPHSSSNAPSTWQEDGKMKREKVKNWVRKTKLATYC